MNKLTYYSIISLIALLQFLLLNFESKAQYNFYLTKHLDLFRGFTYTDSKEDGRSFTAYLTRKSSGDCHHRQQVLRQYVAKLSHEDACNSDCVVCDKHSEYDSSHFGCLANLPLAFDLLKGEYQDGGLNLKICDFIKKTCICPSIAAISLRFESFFKSVILKNVEISETEDEPSDSTEFEDDKKVIKREMNGVFSQMGPGNAFIIGDDEILQIVGRKDEAIPDSIEIDPIALNRAIENYYAALDVEEARDGFFDDDLPSSEDALNEILELLKLRLHD